jgi:hypothetical protein
VEAMLEQMLGIVIDDHIPIKWISFIFKWARCRWSKEHRYLH